MKFLCRGYFAAQHNVEEFKLARIVLENYKKTSLAPDATLYKTIPSHRSFKIFHITFAGRAVQS